MAFATLLDAHLFRRRPFAQSAIAAGGDSSGRRAPAAYPWTPADPP